MLHIYVAFKQMQLQIQLRCLLDKIFFSTFRKFNHSALNYFMILFFNTPWKPKFGVYVYECWYFHKTGHVKQYSSSLKGRFLVTVYLQTVWFFVISLSSFVKQSQKNVYSMVNFLPVLRKKKKKTFLTTQCTMKRFLKFRDKKYLQLYMWFKCYSPLTH